MTFQPSGLGLTWFNERYAAFPGEVWEQGCDRLSRHVAQPEREGETRLLVEQSFYEELVTNRFMPGGRIWYGAGRPKAQLLNCFVAPTTDSREGWGKTFYDVTVISSLGGGVGLNCSPVRPRGTPIRGTGGRATGAVSLMRAINGIGAEIKDGGGRRAALMLCLEISHPDIEEFLDAKLNRGELENANVSIVINIPTDDFIERVRSGGRIPLSFNGQPYGEIDAAHLWGRLVTNAWKSGEPGVLNSYLANQQSNIWYHKPLVSTNPCGEIWLEEYGCCCLGALVLPRFVRGGTLDWEQLASTIRLGVRFLDNVLSVNYYPLPEIETNCKDVRRLGLGVMGLHNMLLALGIKYSEGAAFVDKLFEFIKVVAYHASVDLAIEKGRFPAYDERLLESGFAQTLPDDLRGRIALHGLRNCALLTIAPTGTTSTVSGVSGGIEPLFAPVYYRRYFTRRDDQLNVTRRELVVDPIFSQYGDLCEGAHDLVPRDHFEIQKAVQKHIDNAVSKTINLPAEFTPGDLAELWLDYLPYCKGTTLYRSGSRADEPCEPVPHDQIPQVLREHGYTLADDPELQNTLDCVSGVCELPVAQVVS